MFGQRCRKDLQKRRFGEEWLCFGRQPLQARIPGGPGQQGLDSTMGRWLPLRLISIGQWIDGDHGIVEFDQTLQLAVFRGGGAKGELIAGWTSQRDGDLTHSGSIGCESSSLHPDSPDELSRVDFDLHFISRHFEISSETAILCPQTRDALIVPEDSVDDRIIGRGRRERFRS